VILSSQKTIQIGAVAHPGPPPPRWVPRFFSDINRPEPGVVDPPHFSRAEARTVDLYTCSLTVRIAGERETFTVTFHFLRQCSHIGHSCMECEFIS